MKLLAIIIAVLFCTGLQASTANLSQAVDLPIVIEGKTVGSMKLPAGSDVEVVSNDGTNAVIKRGDGTYTIASSSLGTSTVVAAASPAASPTATPIQIPFQASAPIDKTLNPSTTVPFFITIGEHSPSDIDASHLGDDFPGAHGWLTVKNGHLFNGDKRLRIIGVNGGDATDEEIGEMKKYGINGVRLWFHGLARKDPHERGKQFEDILHGVQIDPMHLSIADKKIAQFIKAGFWVDLNIIGNPVLGQLDDKIRELHKAFLKSLLTHVNPYTGKAYGEDPAIFTIEIANEESAATLLSGKAKRSEDPNKYKNQVTEKWNKWLIDKYKTQNALNAAWTNNKETLGAVEWLPGKAGFVGTGTEQVAVYKIPPLDPSTPPQKRKDWNDFCLFVATSYTTDLVSYIHNDLHYKGLVMTGCVQVPPGMQNLGDASFEHPYNLSDDTSYGATSSKKNTLRRATYWHIAGKPYFGNESATTYPNQHIGDSALYAFSAAAAQDWDGVFLFNWSMNRHAPTINHFFAQAPENMICGEFIVPQNPALMASLPTVINLFKRGDLKPLKETFVNRFNGFDVTHDSKAEYEMMSKVGWYMSSRWPVDEKFLDHTFSERTSIVFDDNTNLPPAIEPGENYSTPKECHKEGENLFIDTPKTVLYIGQAPSTSDTTNAATSIKLSNATFEIGKTELGWACVSATSLDNADLKDSKKILVSLIGRTGNTGSCPFKDLLKKKKESTEKAEGGETGDEGASPNIGLTQEELLQCWGTAPVVTECISANIFIPVDTSKGHFKAYSLDEKAQKKAEIPLEITPEGITLHTTGKEGTVWYEIVRL